MARADLPDLDANGREPFDDLFGNRLEFDIIPDQETAAIVKIRLETKQLGGGPAAFFDVAAQAKGRGPGKMFPE